jgi:voltage-dependent calcium channel
MSHDPLDRGSTKDTFTAYTPSKSPTKLGHASTSSTASGWRVATLEQERPYISQGSRTLEAPFRLAMEKQRSLSEQGRPYLRHSWNRIDFVSIVSFWIMFALSVANVEATPTHHIYIFRALSVLRISRLLGVTSGTAVRRYVSCSNAVRYLLTSCVLCGKTIMRSLKKAAPLLVRVATFVLFAIVLFS